MNFVVEYTTMSKPCSIGRNSAGVSTVLSMIVGSPWRVRGVGDLPVVRHVVLRVAGRFEVNRAGVLVHQLAEGFRLARIEEPHLDAELREGLREQRPRPAVQARRRDEVLPRVHDRQQGRGDRRLAAGERQSRRAAIERREAFFEHIVGGVHQAGVDVAEFLQGEQIGRVIGVLEHIAGRRVDRHGPRRGRGVGHLPGVQRQSAKMMVGCVVRHGCLLISFLISFVKSPLGADCRPTDTEAGRVYVAPRQNVLS